MPVCYWLSMFVHHCVESSVSQFQSPLSQLCHTSVPGISHELKSASFWQYILWVHDHCGSFISTHKYVTLRLQSAWHSLKVGLGLGRLPCCRTPLNTTLRVSAVVRSSLHNFALVVAIMSSNWSSCGQWWRIFWGREPPLLLRIVVCCSGLWPAC